MQPGCGTGSATAHAMGFDVSDDDARAFVGADLHVAARTRDGGILNILGRCDAALVVVGTSRQIVLTIAIASEPVSLVVDPRGHWFELGSRPRTLLGRSPIMSRLLLALARARVESPSAVVSADALIKEVWPDESLRNESARHRLSTLIFRLRQTSLGTFVEGLGGYRLSPLLDLRWGDCTHSDVVPRSDPVDGHDAARPTLRELHARLRPSAAT
jgi:hypothetical protein